MASIEKMKNALFCMEAQVKKPIGKKSTNTLCLHACFVFSDGFRRNEKRPLSGGLSEFFKVVNDY